MGSAVRFAADGWKARVGEDFTEENVARVAAAAAKWFARTRMGSKICVGFDMRPGAEDTALLAGAVLSSCGFAAEVSQACCPLPAVSWAVAHDDEACGGYLRSLLDAYTLTPAGMRGDLLPRSADGPGEWVAPGGRLMPRSLWDAWNEDLATGYYAIDPFLIGMPLTEDGSYVYDIDASPKLELEKKPTPPPTEEENPETGEAELPIVPLLVGGVVVCVAAALLIRRKGDSADK